MFDRIKKLLSNIHPRNGHLFPVLVSDGSNDPAPRQIVVECDGGTAYLSCNADGIVAELLPQYIREVCGVEYDIEGDGLELKLTLKGSTDEPDEEPEPPVSDEDEE